MQPSSSASRQQTQHAEQQQGNDGSTVHPPKWSDTSFAFYWNRWLTAKAEHDRKQSDSSPGFLGRIHQHVEERIGIEPEDSPQKMPAVKNIVQELAKRLDDLVGFLGDRPYFYSDQLSVADLAVFGMLLVMRHGPMPGSADLFDDRPTLADHTARMTALTGTSVSPS